ncbi:putative WRKY transcription factor 70 [Curcuma longa]|uniref:putative WRKY transcription factor 70 n=1 Tax=Curcuma longa TaxID=136217 RepID=UPI003D9EA037
MGMDSHDHDQGSSWRAMKMVIRELLKGQDSATRLQALLQLKESLPPENYSGPVKELLVEVRSSISRAISLLGTEMTAEAPLGHANLLSSDEQKSESSRKIGPPRRSGYRRRSHPYTCRTVYAKDIEDGYTWRKYGQKIIHGTTHQRSYYRCTHKFDRECHATRQVQKTEDASMFAITYMGEHTCMDATESAAPCIISFESGDTANTQREAPLFSAPPLPSLKLECDEEMPSSRSPRSASSELLVFPDLSDLEGSAPAALFTGGASDQYDVTSSIQSPISSLEMEFDPETFMFGDMLNFGDII